MHTTTKFKKKMVWYVKFRLKYAIFRYIILDEFYKIKNLKILYEFSQS